MEYLTAGECLRALVAEDCIPVPGAPSVLAARLIDSVGFPAAYLSGAAFSANQLGLPDVGLFTLTELAEQTRRLTSSMAIPLIVDADTGFGEPINVYRAVVELESAGAGAIQLEDQGLPKRCGHLSGKTLVSSDEMVEKVRAAVEARDDESMVLIARTDARAIEGIDAAIDRAKAYVDAGADWIFVEALEEEGEFERVAHAIGVPLVANMTEFGKSPLLPIDTLGEMGYSVVLYPVTLLRVAMRAMEVALATIIQDGSQDAIMDLMQTREELYELLEYDDFEELDRRFFGGSDES